MQWVFYLFSAFTLVVYSIGLRQVNKPNLLSFSLVLVIFTLDTALTCFFTVWFSAAWFSAEAQEFTDPKSTTIQSAGAAIGPGKELNPRGKTLESQSASQSYEFFFTILFTVITLVARFYFNFIMVAFVQRLLRHPKYMVDQDDVEQNLKNRSFFQRWWIKSEKSCYKFCRRYLA